MVDREGIKLNMLRELKYGVHLPAGYERAEEPWPILCYLHGVRECGRKLDDDEKATKFQLAQHGPLKDRKDQAAIENFIVDNFIIVVPQVSCAQAEGERSFADNTWSMHALTVKDIVLSVQKEYRGDRERIYLSGFSLGANGVFDIAQTQREVWAALWPVDPTREFGDDCGRPIWLWHGNDRRYSPINQTTKGPKRLNLQAVPAEGELVPPGNRLCTDTVVGHVPTATGAYAKRKVYEWLLSKRSSVPVR